MIDNVELLKRKVIDDANKQYAAKIRVMFGDLLRTSPQWSGDFASNWYITDNPNDFKYNPSPFKGHTRKDAARQMGDMDSIRGTISKANFVKISYDRPVYFVNDTPIDFEEDTIHPFVTGLGGQPYPGAHMASSQPVRPENLIDGRVALGSYLHHKYSAI